MKIAILSNHFLFSELNYEIGINANHFNSLPHNEISIFTCTVTSKMMDVNSSVYNISSLCHFNGGLIIATTFQTANILNGIKTPADKAYYVYDLEWLYKPINYEFVYNTISNLPLFVKSKLHQQYIDNIFSLPSTVSKFNIGEIWNSRRNTKMN